jgi:hypothetical protein
LRRRQVSLLIHARDFSDEQVERAVVDLSLNLRKPFSELEESEAQDDPHAA